MNWDLRVTKCELEFMLYWLHVIGATRSKSATIISAPVVGLRCFIVYYLNVPHEQYLKSTANDWPTDRPPGCPVPTSSLRRNNFSGFLSVWVLLACHVTSVGTVGAPDGVFFRTFFHFSASVRFKWPSRFFFCFFFLGADMFGLCLCHFKYVFLFLSSILIDILD